jgi:UDP-galactopyranose mutase
VPVVFSKEKGYFKDKYQLMPRLGYTSLLNNMLDHVNIQCKIKIDSKDVIKLDEKNSKVIYEGEEFNGHIIYTGSIEELLDYKYGELPYRSLDFKFEKIEAEYFQKKAVINYPNEHEHTRITEFKHFYPNQKSNNSVIAYEYPCEYLKNNNPYYPISTEKNMELYNNINQNLRNTVKFILPED